MHYFIGLVIISVCFNIDVRIYGTLLPPPPPPRPFFSSSHPGFFCHFDIDVCIYSTFFFFLFLDCHVDFDVDNVEHRELVIFYGV